MRQHPNRDWVPCQDYGQATVQVITPTTTQSGIRSFILVQPPEVALEARISDFDPALLASATPSYDDSIRAIRVVGQSICTILPPETVAPTVFPLRYCERIHVGLLDRETPDTAAIVPDSLFDEQDANELFVWQRYTQLFTVGVDTPLRELPGYLTRADYEIDVRTQRRLSEGECLIYSTQLQSDFVIPGESVLSLQTHLYLRTLVSRR